MLRHFLRAVALMLTLASPATAEIVSLQAVQPAMRVGIDRSGRLSLQGATAMTLEMVRLNGNHVAFRDPQSGLFLRAGVGALTELALASQHIRGWETFELIPNGPGYALRSVQNGMYVGADPANPRLAAVWGTRGMGQTYLLLPVGQQAPAAPITAPGSFAGTWRLHGVFANGSPMALNDQALGQAQITIGQRGAIHGTSGCNSFDAQISQSRGQHDVTDFLTTRRGCPDAAGQVERSFFSALTAATLFDLSPQRQWLDLRDSNGSLLARLRRM